jgi:hypothetical protein
VHDIAGFDFDAPVVGGDRQVELVRRDLQDSESSGSEGQVNPLEGFVTSIQRPSDL